MRSDFRRDLVTRSGRYLVAGSRCLGDLVGGGRGRRGEVSSGRQAADNNQAWTADGRTQDNRVQSAEHKARPARGLGFLKDEGKGNNNVVRNVGGAGSRP